MPDPSNYDNEDDWMAACVPTMMDEGREQDQAVAACLNMWRNKAASDRVQKAYSTLNRAYSRLDVKALDNEQRVIKGIASTPTVDRVGDIVEPMGAQFTVPMMLHLDHNKEEAVGHVIFAKPTKSGIPFEARIVKFDEPGEVKNLVDKAWHLVKTKLRSFVSIGFRPLQDGVELMKDGGLRFNKWEWLELSLVSIPANSEAVIMEAKSLDGAALRELKSIDQGLQAAPGQSGVSGVRTVTVGSDGGSGGAQGPRKAPSPDASGKHPPVILKRKEREMNATYQEHIGALEATRASKQSRMDAIMAKAMEEGRSTDAEEREEFDTLERDVESIDGDLKRFRSLQAKAIETAKPVTPQTVKTMEDGTAVRTGMIRVRDPEMPPGVRLARVAKCLAMAEGVKSEALRMARQHYASDAPTIATLEAACQYGNVSDLAIKAAVPAGSTSDTQWAGALVTAVTGEAGVVGDFLEYLRPRTIIGQFGANGVPALRRVPFRTGLITQHSEGTGYWVGEGAPKPVTKVDLSRRTLTPTKVANIAVVTDELMRDSSPSADVIVRDAITNALRTRLDSDFIDPAITASGARPASITNGVTAQTSFSAGGGVGGGTAVSLRRDINRAVDAFIDANLQADSLVWIMRANTAMKLSMMVNSLGEPDALVANIGPNGGRLAGIPVITSQFVPATSSPTGDYVVLMDAQSIWFADEGGFTIDFSREASVEMADNPTGAAFTGSPGSVTTLGTTALVSFFQENLVGWRAERTVNWLRARPNAVVVIESVNWGE